MLPALFGLKTAERAPISLDAPGPPIVASDTNIKVNTT